MKIKKFLCVLLSLFVLCGLVGCGERDVTDDPAFSTEWDPSSPTVTLKFTHIWPEHVGSFERIVANFEKKYSNIKIDMLEKSHNNILSSLNSAWTGSNMPDVYFYWTHQMLEVVNEDRQMAMDLTPLYEEDEFRSRFIGDGENWISGKINDRYYNVPFRATGFVIYYNKTLFDAHGWEAPANFEGLIDLLATIKAEAPALIPLDCYGTSGTFSYIKNALSVYMDILSGKSEDPMYRSGRLTATDKELTDLGKIYDKVRDWAYTKKYFGGSVAAGTNETCEQNFMLGKSAMTILNNNSYAVIKQGMPEGTEIGCFSIPAFSEIENSAAGYVSGGYDGFCISNKSRHKDAALVFLRYLCSDEAMQLFADAEKSVMASKNVVYTDPTQAEIAATMARVGMLGTVRDWVPSDAVKAMEVTACEYMLGMKDGTGKDIATQDYNESKRAITDSILNPGKQMITPTFTAKNYDKFLNWIS